MSLWILIPVLIATNLAAASIGWLLGITARNTMTLVAEVEAVAHKSSVPEPERRRLVAALRKVRPMHIVAVLLFVMGGIQILVGVSAQTQANTAINCIQRFQTENANALNARSKPSQDVLAAQDRIWLVVADAFADPSPDAREQIAKAITDYNKVRDTQLASQRDHPLPDPPRGLCIDE